MHKLFHASVCASLLLFTAAASASGLGDVLKDRAIESVTPKTPSLGLGKGSASVDFDQLPKRMKGKACDYVLENAVGL